MLCDSCDRSPPLPLTAYVVAHARIRLPGLLQAAREFDATASLAIALPLIGAGPGLTPSWDDFLIGFLCGLRAIGGNPSRSRFFMRFGSGIAEAGAATTAVSREYIRRTVERAGPIWIEDVLAAVAAGDSMLTTGAAARALRVGHTSGTDMMLGALFGACVWQDGTEADEMLLALSCPHHRPISVGAGKPQAQAAV